jgi:putative spermidine/putrescine transport system substrate-binding protein
MNEPRPRTDSLLSRRLGRRALVRGGAVGAVLLGVNGCLPGEGEKSPTPSATATPTPLPTPDLTPTPTQEVIASPVPGYADPSKWKGRTLTIAGLGADYQSAQAEAYFKPFSMATGATIQLKQADNSRLKSQVDNGEVSWDLTTLQAVDVLELAHEGYLTPINYDIVDATALFPDAALQYGVGSDYYSTVLIYPAETDNAPQGWPSVWDVPPLQPGEDVQPADARSLQKSPIGTLEFALIADGVEPTNDALYPLDIERAFASLERIRNYVLVWWEDGKQPVELVVADQAAMASAWNVRIAQLQQTSQVRIQWYGGMLSADCWAIPNGAPNADVAMDFINFATRAVPNANFSRIVPYGPVNTGAFNLLRSDRLDTLPSAPTNRTVQFIQNANWWVDNRGALTSRFNEWLLTPPKVPATPRGGS